MPVRVPRTNGRFRFGVIQRPAAVAVDDEGLLYVADWGMSGAGVDAGGGGCGDHPGGLGGLALGADYFAANPRRGRRAMRRPGAEIDPAGERDREESANVEKLLWGPTAVKLDGEGRIFIVDSCRHRLQVYWKERKW